MILKRKEVKPAIRPMQPAKKKEMFANAKEKVERNLSISFHYLHSKSELNQKLQKDLTTMKERIDFCQKMKYGVGDEDA